MKKRIIIFLFCVSHLIFLYNSPLETTADDIPIIFIHLGYADYLAHSLWQALQYNKNVILISDDENNKHGLDVHYYDIAQFKHEADQFAKEYVHLCAHKRDTVPIMLSHLQRWFVLKAFMETFNIPVCFQCDSDVMIYSNIADEIKKFTPCDLALVSKQNNNPKKYVYPIKFSDNTVIIKKELLQDYCKFIHWFYTDKENLNLFLDLYQKNKIQRFVGGMFLISRYMDITDAQEKFIIKNICEIIDDTAFDSFISNSFGRQFNINKQNLDKRYIRIIEWIDNQPYCYNKALNRMIRFNTLHFATNTKPLMADYKKENIQTKREP